MYMKKRRPCTDDIMRYDPRFRRPCTDDIGSYRGKHKLPAVSFAAVATLVVMAIACGSAFFVCCFTKRSCPEEMKRLSVSAA